LAWKVSCEANFCTQTRNLAFESANIRVLKEKKVIANVGGPPPLEYHLLFEWLLCWFFANFFKSKKKNSCQSTANYKENTWGQTMKDDNLLTAFFFLVPLGLSHTRHFGAQCCDIFEPRISMISQGKLLMKNKVRWFVVR